MNPTCKDCEKEMRCEDCRFWFLDKNDPNKAGEIKDGECRADPPQVLLVPMSTKIGLTPGLQVNGFFPKTRPDIWCGKFMRLMVVGKSTVVEKLMPGSRLKEVPCGKIIPDIPLMPLYASGPAEPFDD